MSNKFITFKGKDYMRHVETIGETEKITFHLAESVLSDDYVGYTNDYTEVFEQELLDTLEGVYENQLQLELSPALPII